MGTHEGHLGLRVVRAALLAGLAGLALLAVVPALLGWRPTVVTSGSMAPAIRTGDVVVTSPLPAAAAAAVPEGAVVLAVNPAHEGTLLMHRVVGRNADGTLTTRGDANLSADSAPMPADHLRGIGRLRIPLIGIPVLHARHGDYLPAIALVVVTVALSAARRRPDPTAS